MKKVLTPKVRVVGFLLLLAILAGTYFVQHKVTEDGEASLDFPSFYYAAKLAFEDELTPYNNSNWRLVKPEYTGEELFPFLYPPPSLLIFRPFISVDYVTAKGYMLWLNRLLLLIFVFLFFFKILKLSPQDSFLFAAVIYLYLFFPILVTLDKGQVSLWVLVSTCLAWWATKEKKHPLWIALPIVFGTILKIYPILLLIVYFFRKDYKTIVYVLVLLFVVSATSTLALPEGIWQDWYTEVASQGYGEEVRGVMIASPANQSLNAFTTRLFYGRNQRFERLLRPPAWSDEAPYILAGVVGLVSVGATWLASKNKMKEPDSLNLQFCIWLLVMFMVSPFSWNYHLVHILPAVYIAVLGAMKRRNMLVTILAIGVALFLAYDFPANDPYFRRGVWTLLISSQLYAVGLLWLYFIILAIRKERTP